MLRKVWAMVAFLLDSLGVLLILRMLTETGLIQILQ